VESFAGRELFPTKSSSEDFAAVIRNEVARMQQVAVTAKIQLD
jgi:tripartite-type tricarboxylate transporter receptor subunit TctC